jgi:signal transduction histidine kinase
MLATARDGLRKDTKSPLRLHLPKLIAVFAAYFITARLGLLMDAVSGFATLVWPPTGISLFVLLRFGYGLWPGVFAGAFAVNAAIGAPLPVAAGIAFGNTLEAVMGAHLLRRAGFDDRLARVRDVVALVVSAAAISTLVSAAIGTGSLLAGHVVQRESIQRTGGAWWLGDALGDLVVAPLLFVWSRSPRFPARRLRYLEASLVLIVLGGCAIAVLVGPVPRVLNPLTAPYVLFPILTWAALRFAQAGATTVAFVASALAITATAFHRGPFVAPTLGAGLLSLQVFMGVSAVMTLVLAAAISERDRAVESANRRELASVFLAKAGEILAASLDYETTLQAIARLVTPVLGDNCVVDVIERDGSIRRVAEASADPAKEQILRRLRDFQLESTHRIPVHEVLRTGRTVFIPHFDDAALDRVARGDEYAEIVRRLAPRSSVTVPLVVRGDVVGAITFGMAESGRTYASADLALAEELGRRAGLAIDNARHYSEAQEAIRARDDFLSIASHELRTPLTALSLQIAIVQRAMKQGDTISDERFGPNLQTIVRQVERLMALIDSLLNVSHITAGRFALKLEETDFAIVVHDVVARFRDQLAKVGSRLQLDVDAPCIGTWDRSRLDEIVTNLVSNAVKYGPGSPIDIQLECTGDQVVLIVRDHGIGISPEDQARIFERFERAVSHHHFGGFGLGLWIVKQIVTALNGTISVKSEPGAGAEFAVRLAKSTAAPEK